VHAREQQFWEDRGISQLKEYHERLAAQERAHLEQLKRVQEEAATRERTLQIEITRLNTTYKIDLDRLTKEMESLRF
jgi:rubrerythrin